MRPAFCDCKLTTTHKCAARQTVKYEENECCGRRSLLMRVVSIRAYPSHEWFAIKLAPVKEQEKRGAS